MSFLLHRTRVFWLEPCGQRVPEQNTNGKVMRVLSIEFSTFQCRKSYSLPAYYIATLPASLASNDTENTTRVARQMNNVKRELIVAQRNLSKSEGKDGIDNCILSSVVNVQAGEGTR